MPKRQKADVDPRLQALGVAVSTRRKTVGLSQRDLAGELKTSQNAVYEWENGLVAPGVDRLWDISRVLETTASELLATAEEIEVDVEGE